MAQRLVIHPKNPQERLVRIAADVLREGKIIIYPTDTAYALGFKLGDKKALARACQIRQLNHYHDLALVCRSMSDVSRFARVDTSTFRLLKAYTPGPYTFMLEATHDLARSLQELKHKSIGVRIPDCKIAQAILEELDEPIMSTSLICPGEIEPLLEPDAIYERYHKLVHLIIDGGSSDDGLTTVISCLDGPPHVVREGKGPVRADLA